jgi:subtilisin family serine protease
MLIPVDTPTFASPANAKEHVPGRVLLRFAPDAIANAASVPASSGAETKLARLPASVNEPLSFLRRNAGLRSVEAVFAPEQVVRQPPSVHDRLAAISSVRDVDDVGVGVTVLHLPDEEVTKPLLKLVAESPAVEVAEAMPARWLFAAADPKANLQWGLPAIRYFQARRPVAKKIRVGIVDSGIDTSHPDLPDPAAYEYAGYSSRDSMGHGTHVAGVIAALTNNGVGITGICDTQLAIWKVFPDGPEDRFLEPTPYLRALREVAVKEVDVVNLSLGGPAHSTIEADLFAKGIETGVTFVAAMGNDYEKGNPISYPAAYDNVISVGAVDKTRGRSHFSNTGPHIDLCAPGSDILSTLPMRGSPQRRETGYGAWSGTSMATPHVTAAAALLAAKRPGRTPVQIAARLRGTAARVPQMNGATWTRAHGNGLLNLRAALI